MPEGPARRPSAGAFLLPQNRFQQREWQDTALVSPREKVEIAFVADNPGNWMFHCHVLEHQAAGRLTSPQAEGEAKMSNTLIALVLARSCQAPLRRSPAKGRHALQEPAMRLLRRLCRLFAGNGFAVTVKADARPFRHEPRRGHSAGSRWLPSLVHRRLCGERPCAGRHGQQALDRAARHQRA